MKAKDNLRKPLLALVKKYQKKCGTSFECSVRDILTETMHLCRESGTIFQDRLRAAGRVFQEEVDEEIRQLAGVAASEILCQRCDSSLTVNGYCRDKTCPFSNHKQGCETGWSGHPEFEVNKALCTCGGKNK